jgi:CHRD domain
VAAGVNGPAIGDLTISKAASGTISGSFELTPQQLSSLRKGGLYVQIHSEKAPDGVLWGWLLK